MLSTIEMDFWRRESFGDWVSGHVVECCESIDTDKYYQLNKGLPMENQM